MTTAAATARWAARHEGRPGWAASYWASATALHRQAVLDVLARIRSPWRSLLEVGCNAGPNLRLIRDRWPWAELSGLDVNAAALAEARQHRAEGALRDVTLLQGRLPEDLAGWPTRSVDVLLSVYCLAYVAPPEWRRVLAECQRIARMAVVLAEPMVPGDAPASEHMAAGHVEWWHPYEALLTASGHRVTVTPCAPADSLTHILLAEVAR